MAPPVLLSLFLYCGGREGHGASRPSVIVFIWSRTGGARRLPSFYHCFLYGRGRERHGASRPSVIVFYMVKDGRGMAPPVLLSLFYNVEDGRGIAPHVLPSFFFI